MVPFFRPFLQIQTELTFPLKYRILRWLGQDRRSRQVWSNKPVRKVRTLFFAVMRNSWRAVNDGRDIASERTLTWQTFTCKPRESATETILFLVAQAMRKKSEK